MEATHKGLPVAGYREQTSDAVEMVNGHKALEERTLRRLDYLAAQPEIDGRWLAIGRTHMELAWMAINRAVFKPGRVQLPEDEQGETLADHFGPGFYRKKPVVISAALFDGELVGEPSTKEAGKVRLNSCPPWFPAVVQEIEEGCPIPAMETGDIISSGNRLFIATLEGIMTAEPGDWIIRGVKGELYPCKPDIFAATYEPA